MTSWEATDAKNHPGSFRDESVFGGHFLGDIFWIFWGTSRLFPDFLGTFLFKKSLQKGHSLQDDCSCVFLGSKGY